MENLQVDHRAVRFPLILGVFLEDWLRMGEVPCFNVIRIYV